MSDAAAPSDAPPLDAPPLDAPPLDAPPLDAPPGDETARSGAVVGDLSIRALGWAIWCGAALLVVAALVGVVAAGLAMTHRMNAEIAGALQQGSLSFGVALAVATMLTAAARAGAIERRRHVERDRFREEAERARRDAFHARQAVQAAADGAAVAGGDVGASLRADPAAASAAERAA